MPPRDLDDLPVVDVELDDDAEWAGVRVHGDFTDQRASHVEIVDCRLDGCRFTATEIDGIHIVDTVFTDCDLSGAWWQRARLRRVRLVGCRLSGVDLAQARFDDVSFLRCKLDEANLRMIDAPKVRFEEAVLTRADLYGAKLVGASLIDGDLSGVQLSQADLSGARLQGSQIETVRGLPELRGASIESGQLLPIAVWLCGALGINVDDDSRGDGPSRR